MKKLLMAASMVLLLSLSAGIASAAESTVAPTASKVLTYTVTLKVGQTYQLGYNPSYGRHYTYYISPNNQDYFGVSSNGMLTAYKYNYQIMPWEDHGVVNVVDASGNEIEEVHVRIIQ
ncbi:hypothetical protein [Paenibacillus kribbensis]|uniref:hypothetical protein n=1 Tax=Paenibacillus kribbensis TaxID=172713 RepID=UPI0015C0CE6E|nr:hypothetical protein [Paenibacillus kribbensis]